jgi:two-component system sensor histidine kinase KdpD
MDYSKRKEVGEKWGSPAVSMAWQDQFGVLLSGKVIYGLLLQMLHGRLMRKKTGKKTKAMEHISKMLMRYRSENIKSIICRAGIMVALLMAASAVGYFFRAMELPETDIAIVYLLAVLLTARFTHGYIFNFLAAVIAAFTFNYFFTEPYFTLTVNAPSYIITFIIMFITALITSLLTTHAKQNEMEARKKEAETRALYTLTNRLTDAADINDIAGIATSTISAMLNSNAGCLCFDENGKPEQTFIQQVSPQKQIRREVPDTNALLHRIEGLRTGCDIGSEFYDWPIYGRETTLGIIRVPREAAAVMNESQTRMLRAMIESTALAMDRFRAAQQRIKYHEEIAQERYRGNLLRSISHDLRTPLAGIMGASEMLMNMTPKDDRRYPLMEGIHKDADWLYSLVENILSLTRLQDGKLVLNQEQEAAEEVIGAAIRHISRHHPEYEIAVNAPDELLLVPMDAKLIRQVLINLLDNAVKHAEPEDEIRVAVTKDVDNNCAVFSVRDSGEGIAPADLPDIFQIFYTSRSKHADAHPGIGLGLAICDAAVKAHGGSITARNRLDGPGVEITFTLPLEVNKS